MVDYSYEAGIKGLKAIAKDMEETGEGNFEKYTEKFLDRFGFVDWYRK